MINKALLFAAALATLLCTGAPAVAETVSGQPVSTVGARTEGRRVHDGRRHRVHHHRRHRGGRRGR